MNTGLARCVGLSMTLAAILACAGVVWLLSVQSAPAVAVGPRMTARPHLPDRGWVRAREKAQGNAQVLPGLFVGPPWPPRSFRLVQFDERAIHEPAATALWNRMAEALGRYEHVPADRLKYYSAMCAEDAQPFRLLSCGGMIRDVQPGDRANSHVVTVEVSPDVDAAAFFDTEYFETYLVGEDGRIEFLHSADPRGLGGKYPKLMAIL